jgi:TRAP-type C4-dicarboxylate transport system permease small subunit
MKFGKLINSGISILCGILLMGIVSLTFFQVAIRNIFKSSISWSDEVAQICMTWMVLFGSIWATKNNQHLNTGFKLHRKLNERQICLIDSILALIIAICAAVVAYRSAIFSFMSMDFAIVSLSWLKMGYIFISLPLAMLGICYYYLKSFFKNLGIIFKKD